MHVNRALLASVVSAFFGAAIVLGCVGDDPVVTPISATDAGGDGGTQPEPTSDASTDAGSPPSNGRCDPTKPFDAPVPVTELNGPYDDSSPHLSWDELTIYFSRRSVSDTSAFQIWYARRGSASEPFGAPTPLPGLSTPDGGADLQPMVSKNDQTLYFASNRNTGTYDLFTATRAAGGSPATNPFGNVAALTNLNHPDSSETRPFLSSDANELWFTGTTPTDSTFQLYVALAPFTTATPAVDLNTAGANSNPALSADGLTIYFASDRPGGKGGEDIWFAKRATLSAAFQAAVSLSTVNTLFNSDQSDVPGWISPDDCVLWMASERSGNLDLYVASRPK